MRIGASTLPLFHRGLLQSINELAGMGFGLIEIMCEAPYAFPDDLLSWRALTNLKSAIRNANVDVVLHAPISDVNLMSPNPGARCEAHRQLLQTARLAHELGAPRVVFHLGGKPTMGLYDAERAYRDALELLEKLLKEAWSLGIKLLMENDPAKPGLGAVSVEDCLRVLSSLEGLGLLLDVGHANTWDPQGNARFISSVGTLIRDLHVSDNHGERDEHLGLGRGNIDFKDILDRLLQLSFDGEVVIEVKNLNELTPSKDMIERILEQKGPKEDIS